QFEAYHIQKSILNAQEAAKCFSEVCEKFSSKPELWQEVEALTNSLRFNSFEPEAVFLREMFGYLSQGRTEVVWACNEDGEEEDAKENDGSEVCREKIAKEAKKEMEGEDNISCASENRRMVALKGVRMVGKKEEDGGILLNCPVNRLETEVQHKLLLMTADRSEDTMDHCRLLLLLLQRFPQSVSVHGVRA
ncbi:unnamed protein product, partial [Timema podura]|nr:unnamed protein product [Timema podura]